MCIVVDSNVLGAVFNKMSVNHYEFAPVLDWVVNGRGMVVYGGTKYLNEAGKKYLDLFAELGRRGKAKNIDRTEVDGKEAWVTAKIQHADFDDQHLIGLLIVSGCKLICSLDTRAYPFFTHSTFFSPADRRPKIYSSRRNADLLVDINIAEICRPAKKMTVAEKQQLPILG